MAKEGWIKKLKRKAHELIKGDRAYMTDKQAYAIKYGMKVTKKKVKAETTRTKDIKSDLKQAGLTQKEIDRLQGKGKK